MVSMTAMEMEGHQHFQSALTQRNSLDGVFTLKTTTMIKTTHCKLQFPKDGNTIPEEILPQMKEDPIFRVSEIEISYSPVVKSAERITISSSADADKVFRRIWCQPIELRECFYALFLNRANKVLGYFLVSVGGITGTVVDPRCVYQAALKASATEILLAHNHPSGNLQPSDADIQITRKLKDAGQLLEINLLDHLILMPEGYTSFADEGML